MAGEAKLESRLRLWAKANGIVTYKFTSPGHSSVPDRIFLRDGRIVFMELKDKGKKPTPLQLRELRILQDNGMHAIWADNFDDAVWYLSKVLGPLPNP